MTKNQFLYLNFGFYYIIFEISSNIFLLFFIYKQIIKLINKKV